MASGNTNFNTINTAAHMTNTQAGPIKPLDQTSTLAHNYATGSSLGTTTAPALSSSTTGHAMPGEGVSKTKGRKDEFVGGMKEVTGKVFHSEKLKAAGYEQKILGKEEVAAAQADKGLVGEKGTLGTAAGARALDDADRNKHFDKDDKHLDKDQKKAAKERAKAEKQAEKEHAKAEKLAEKEQRKEHGHKWGKKDHTATTAGVTEPHTEPFVGRVDRLGANHDIPHVEPHVAAMMAHGMPIQGQAANVLPSYEKPLVGGAYEQPLHERSLQQPLDQGFTSSTIAPTTVIAPSSSTIAPSSSTIAPSSSTTFVPSSSSTLPTSTTFIPSSSSNLPASGISSGSTFSGTSSLASSSSNFSQPLAGSNYESEKAILQKPMAGGIVKETYEKEVILPKNDLSSQKFLGGSGSNFDKFGSERMNPADRLNVSPRADRLALSPRGLNVSPRCDTTRLEQSPRHMARV